MLNAKTDLDKMAGKFTAVKTSGISNLSEADFEFDGIASAWQVADQDPELVSLDQLQVLQKSPLCDS